MHPFHFYTCLDSSDPKRNPLALELDDPSTLAHFSEMGLFGLCYGFVSSQCPVIPSNFSETSENGEGLRDVSVSTTALHAL